jgi:hypothetical protein
MGTWDDGLLDNDTALDGLGDLRSKISGDFERLGAAKPSAASTAKLAAAVGVLLQLSSYEFGLDTPDGPKIVAAVKAHAKEIAKLPAAARRLLNRIAAGEGQALAERPAKMSAKAVALLHKDSKQCSFGKREGALFASIAGAAYVQEVAKRCIAMVDEDFEDEDNWSDLCREGMGMGCLGVLLVLDPCKVPVSNIERWRKRAKKGFATLEKEPDDELDFHRGYYANLDGVLALLAKRFAT